MKRPIDFIAVFIVAVSLVLMMLYIYPFAKPFQDIVLGLTFLLTFYIGTMVAISFVDLADNVTSKIKEGPKMTNIIKYKFVTDEGSEYIDARSWKEAVVIARENARDVCEAKLILERFHLVERKVEIIK